MGVWFGMLTSWTPGGWKWGPKVASSKASWGVWLGNAAVLTSADVRR